MAKVPKVLRSPAIWIQTRHAARDPDTGLPQQTGALPWRFRRDKLQILLVTGRLSKRWNIPKGWPMFGKTLAEAAAQEAFEEGGVIGVPGSEPIGRFDHTKAHGLLGTLSVTILVFPLEATKALNKWPEKDERERRWLEPRKAAKLVDNDELKALLLRFAPAEKGR